MMMNHAPPTVGDNVGAGGVYDALYKVIIY